MSDDETQSRQGTFDPNVPVAIHPVKQEEILKVWLRGLKGILAQGMFPRVLISIRVDSHLEQKFQINITYPGLTTKQALPLIAMAGQALNERLQKEGMAEGPKLIIPKMTP